MVLLDKRQPGPVPRRPQQRPRIQPIPEPSVDPRTLVRVEEEQLIVDGVMKTFKKRMVVKGVSINLKRGESVGLLGPNGAGKTTVFYMITGLIKPDEGSVFIDGYDVTKLSDVPARAAWHWLSSAGSVNFPRAVGRGQHHGGP